MYASNHTIKLFGISRQKSGAYSRKAESVLNYFTEDIGKYNNTVIMYKKGHLNGQYITIHINNVPRAAFDYYMNGEFEKLYDMRSYNTNIGNYYDAKILDAIPFSPNNPHPFTVKYPLLYLYAAMLAYKVQEEVYRFMPSPSYYEDLEAESAINKNMFYSRVSMLYELILKTYTIEALFDQTKETEVYIFTRIYLPAFYNDVLKYLKFAEYTDKTELTDPSDSEFTSNNTEYLSKLLRPTSSLADEGADVNFDTDASLVDEYGCCVSTNNEALCGKNVEFLQGDEMPIVLFFRILKQTDGIINQSVTNLRTKTSYIFDNSVFDVREIFGFPSTQRFYVLEIYYDSYFALIRDRKDYCFSVMLNKYMTAPSLSSIDVKDVYAIFYERHIHRNKKAFCDNFFISTYHKQDDIEYATFYLYNNNYMKDTDKYITYLALSPAIKNFIFYYHDEKDLYKIQRSNCQREKCRNKLAFLFLTKRMHYTIDNSYTLSHDVPLRIDWTPYKHKNTFIMKEIKELSGLIRFLAAIHLGFEPLMFIDKEFRSQNTFRKIKTKTRIDYSSIPQYKRKTYLDVSNLPMFLELENATKIVIYHAKVDGKSNLIFNIFGSEIFASNVYEMLYNIYYNEESVNARHFRYYLSMDEVLKIISCGNMLCYIQDFKEFLSVWFSSYFLSHYADENANLSIRTDNADQNIGEGGIILFIDYIEFFELPFRRVFRSEDIVRMATGEDEPIILVDDPILRNRVLDRRLYAFGLPSFFEYPGGGGGFVNIAGSPVMMTYTDRHYHITVKENKKNRIKYGMMIDIDGSNKDLYKISFEENNIKHYFYYKKECRERSLYTAISKLEEILDVTFISSRVIRDDFFYEVMPNVNGEIDLNQFYPQEFYNSYIANNISKIRIPIVVREFVTERSMLHYNSFFLVSSKDIYMYPSIFEDYTTRLVRKEEFYEYSRKENLYYREVLYNKYIRSIIIFANSELYRVISSREFTNLDITYPDFRFNVSFETKTKKEVIEMLENPDEISVLNDNLASVRDDDTIVVARATIELPSAEFGLIDQTTVFIYL